MPAVNQFGTTIDPFTVENDMKEHIKKWLATYLGEKERNTGRQPGELPIPSYTTKTRFDAFPEDALPLIVIISPGTTGKPYKQGKSWSATWILRITAITTAPDEDVTRELAHLYIDAIRELILQWKMINNNENVESVEWVGDAYNLIASSETRTLAASQAIFHVEYSNVVDETQGPSKPIPSDETPPTDPGPWPLVKEGGVHVTINKEKLTE